MLFPFDFYLIKDLIENNIWYRLLQTNYLELKWIESL